MEPAITLSNNNLALLINNIQKTQLSLTDWQTEKLNFIPLRGSWFANSETDFDLEIEVNKFLSPQNNKKVMLLMGDSGAGKSLYTQGLFIKLWQNFSAQSPIPIWLSLPSLKDPINKVIEEALEKYGFNKDQIEEVRKTRSFVFILDAYDEIRCEKNLYQTNNLDKWNAKIIFTCRREYLYHKDNYKLFFAPYIGDKIQYGQYEEVHIRPFNSNQIQTYVQQYIHTQKPNWKEPEKYQKAIEEITGLKELIKTPFMLKLTMEVLPQIVEKYATQNVQERKKVTQAALYDVFIEQWFLRQELKLKQAKQIKDNEDIKPEFWAYAKELATEMHKSKLTQVIYNPNEGSDLFSTETQESRWTRFFTPINPRIEILRSACLIRETSQYQYTFIHSSLLEYFLTRNLYENIATQNRQLTTNLDSNAQEANQLQPIAASSSSLNTTGRNNQNNTTNTKEDYFNQRLLVKEENTLQFLADRVSEQETFKTSLFDRVYSSRNNPLNKISAANAITILNRARVAFSGMNLSEIHIPEADLSFAILTSTNLSKVDLRGVNFRQANLLCSDLTASEMADVNFGQLPFLENQQESYLICSSKDGCYLAIASKNNIEIWDAKTRKQYKSFSTQSTVRCMAYSPDNKLLAIGSGDTSVNDNDISVQIWSVLNQKPVWQPLIGHTRGVKSIAFSPDGEIIASGGKNFDSTVHLWSVKTKASFCLPVKLDSGTAHIDDIVFSPDGNILAITDSHAIRLWSLEKQTIIHSLRCQSVHSLAFSPDGKMLVSGSAGKILQLWSMETLSPLGSPMVGHTHYVHSVSFSKDGKLLASGSEDKTVRLWSVQSQTPIGLPMFGHIGSVRDVTFIDEDKILVSASEDKTLRFWSLDRDISSINQPILLDTGELDCIAFSADGKLAALAGGGEQHAVWLWSLVTQMRIGQPMMGHKATIKCLAFSKDGKYLASGSYDYNVRLWNVKTQESYGMLPKHTRSVNSVAFSDDSKLLVSGSDDTTVRLWNIETKQQIGTPLIEHTDKVMCVAIRSDGKFLVSGGEKNSIVVWSVEKLAPVCSRILMHNSRVTCVAFSPDGKMIVSGSWDKTLRLWSVEPFSSKGDLTAAHMVTTVAFSHDGKLLASGGIDNIVRLYNMVSLTALCIVYNGVEEISCIRFTQDDAYLLIATRNNISILQSTHSSEIHSYSLFWQTGISPLVVKKLNLTKVQNLSENNYQLLKQSGAIDSVLSPPSYYSNTSSSSPTFYKPASDSKVNKDKNEKNISTDNKKDKKGDAAINKKEACKLM